MTHTPHELADEFPEMAQQMAALRQSDGHFAKISTDYHTLNRAIHRAETDVEPTSDDHITQMRKERIALKDAIYTYLKTQSQPG